MDIKCYFELSREETAFWAQCKDYWNPGGQGNGEGTSLIVYQDIGLLPTFLVVVNTSAL